MFLFRWEASEDRPGGDVRRCGTDPVRDGGPELAGDVVPDEGHLVSVCVHRARAALAGIRQNHVLIKNFSP